MSINKKTIINNLDNLGNREAQIFKMLAKGMRTGEIARQLTIKPNTVSTIKKVIYKKLGLSSSYELFKFATDHHLLN